MKISILCLSTLFLIWGCQAEKSPQTHSDVYPPADSHLAAPEPLWDPHENYLAGHDLDGDGERDYMHFRYTGGAHCCYLLSLKLSSQTDTIHYPFEMDGGYGFGKIDGSQHDQFAIRDVDADGRPEIFMGIQTYNGEKGAIPAAWTETYGISTNAVLFDFREGEMRVVDWEEK
ncbi:MAG: hypothetical protein AAFR61_19425 [Bacteroidota bacterium]